VLQHDTVSELREALERDGVVRVADVIAPDDLRTMSDCVRACIATVELVEVTGALRPARGTELALWSVGRDPALAALPRALAATLGRVFGPGQWAQVDGELGGFAMPNLPCPGAPWSACAAAWHVDEPTPPGQVPGNVLLAFALLDRVEPGGGATVALAGSHRRLAALADDLATLVTTDIALAELARVEPWFADLIHTGDLDRAHPCLRAGCVSDRIPLHVVELTGEPGDILLMDPRCLHTTSANVSARPRLLMRMTCMRP
jgi:Phytanoyl-CoA dioxygenase (PhyH)